MLNCKQIITHKPYNNGKRLYTYNCDVNKGDVRIGKVVTGNDLFLSSHIYKKQKALII